MGIITLPDSPTDYDTLYKSYDEFLAPQFKITCGGKTFDTDTLPIRQLNVQTTIEAMADSASFTIEEGFDPQQTEFTYESSFELAQTIEIDMGYGNQLKTVFSGYIVSVAYEFPSEGEPLMTVRCMDMTFLMMKTYSEKVWQKKKHSEVAQDIASSYSSQLFIDATDTIIENIYQNKQADYLLLRELAQRSNRQLLIVGKSVYFRKVVERKTPFITLTWGQGLISLRTEMNISSQLSGVNVRSWDQLNRQLIASSSYTVVKIGNGTQTGSQIAATLGTYEEYVDMDGESQTDVQSAADSMMQSRSMDFINGYGECIGIPDLRAGLYIAFAGVGKRAGSIAYLSEVNHMIDDSGYIIQFETKGNAI
jgi:phage protein D